MASGVDNSGLAEPRRVLVATLWSELRHGKRFPECDYDIYDFVAWRVNTGPSDSVCPKTRATLAMADATCWWVDIFTLSFVVSCTNGSSSAGQSEKSCSAFLV